MPFINRVRIEMTKITVSLIKADVGGYPGYSSVHPALIETAESKLGQSKKSGALIDFRVLACGDDLEGRGLINLGQLVN